MGKRQVKASSASNQAGVFLRSHYEPEVYTVFRRFQAVVTQCAVITTLALVTSTSNAQAQNRLTTTELSAGIHTIRAEVAATEESRRTGLMFRESMKPTDGMLFVFDAPDRQCFWMRNTLIALSIAFIRDDGTISNIADMAPASTDTHCSRGAVRYGLEMNQGWFAERGIVADDKIDGLP